MPSDSGWPSARGRRAKERSRAYRRNLATLCVIAALLTPLAIAVQILALFFLLDSSADIEAFGTDPRYIAFLQKDLAPVLGGLTGADVVLDHDFPPIRPVAGHSRTLGRYRDNPWPRQLGSSEAAGLSGGLGS